MTSPLMDDPNAKMAAGLASEPEGRLLAVYASIRATSRVPNSLIGLGLPLLAYVLDSLDDKPRRVAAVRGRHSAHNPLLGLGTDVEIWTILIRCESDLTVTVDIAAGPWTTDVGPLELRVEWMRSDRVTTFHPKGVSILTGKPADASLGLTGLEKRLLDAAADLCDLFVDNEVPFELAAAMRIVEAARKAAATDGSVDLMS